MSVAAGKPVDVPTNVHNKGLPPQIVRLEFPNVAEGWTVVLLGDGQPVRSVFADPDDQVEVILRLTPPDGAEAGRHDFVLAAKSGAGSFELPLQITVGETVPVKL